MKQKIKFNKLSSMLVYLIAVTFIILFSMPMALAQSTVDLGTAEDYVILSKSGISTTGTTAITGNIGVSPIDSTAITGFDLIADASNTFSTSSLVTGKIYAADYTSPTDVKMTTAISDMETAYADAAGRTETNIVTELGAGDISGMTLTPGLYKWGTGVLINGGVTLSGNANDVWIFQIAEDLTVGNGAIITLSDGAQAKNIFWQVAGQTTLGTTSDFKGIILCQTLIEMNTGATLNGRALAQTAVTLDANTVLIAAGSTPIVIPTIIVSPKFSNDDNDNDNNEEDKASDLTNKESFANDVETEVEESQTNQGIGQELSEQISEKKEEIKSGNYTGSLGQLMNVKELTQDLKELRVNGVAAQTELEITVETDSNGKTKLKTKLQNGTEVEIKIMPDTASERALERLRIKVCSQDNNCTIQLKSVGTGDSEKVQYEVQLERHSKILGLFQEKMQVRADVDAENGDTKVHKPWWAFMAVEPVD